MRMRKHGRIMLNGLIVVAPLLITGVVLVVAFQKLDSAMRGLLDAVFGWSFPGLGVLAGVAGIYVVGLLTKVWLFSWAVRVGEGIVERIPLVKSLYAAVRDLLQFLGGPEAEARGRPAVLSLQDGSFSMLGLITQEKPEKFLPGDPDRVAVYLPMSYQIGGYTVFAPPEAVRVIEEMTVEELMKLSLTAGVGRQRAAVQPAPRTEPEEPAQDQ